MSRQLLRNLKTVQAEINSLIGKHGSKNYPNKPDRNKPDAKPDIRRKK